MINFKNTFIKKTGKPFTEDLVICSFHPIWVAKNFLFEPGDIDSHAYRHDLRHILLQWFSLLEDSLQCDDVDPTKEGSIALMDIMAADVSYIDPETLEGAYLTIEDLELIRDKRFLESEHHTFEMKMRAIHEAVTRIWEADNRLYAREWITRMFRRRKQINLDVHTKLADLFGDPEGTIYYDPDEIQIELLEKAFGVEPLSYEQLKVLAPLYAKLELALIQFGLDHLNHQEAKQTSQWSGADWQKVTFAAVFDVLLEIEDAELNLHLHKLTPGQNLDAAFT